jgi:hypothetical protein
VLDAKDEENSKVMCNIDHEAASPYTIHTAVLPKPSLIVANINSAITAMLGIVQPKNDDVNEDWRALTIPRTSSSGCAQIIPASLHSLMTLMSN